MSAQKDLLIVVGLIMLLGVIWFAGGGTQRGVPDFFINPLPPVGSGTTYSEFSGRGSGLIPGISTGGNTPGGAGAQEAIAESLERIQYDGEPSPYAGTVSIDSLRNTSKTDPAEEYIQLRGARNLEQPVSITGWSLVSTKTNRSVTIGDGAELPKSGARERTGSIELDARHVAYITSGRSPIGVSFRTNMCTGYFEQFQDFTPSLSRQCPSPEAALDTYPEESDLDQECIDYIEQLPRCRMQVTTPTFLSNACRAFLTDRVNYNGCVTEHKTDANFYNNEWRVFLGHTQEQWRSSRETLLLLDANGRVVDIATH